MKNNIAVLVSGGGTNLQALLDAEKSGIIKSGHITLVVSSKPGVYALTRAENAGIKSEILERKAYDSITEYSVAMRDLLLLNNIDIVVLAGFMTILDESFCEAFAERIINVHPALLSKNPEFGGKSFYGIKVHEAVLQSGVKTTGATVHIVTPECDRGPILLEKEVDVLEGDTPEILQKRVMEQAEWIILPQAVEILIKDSKNEN
ncbi:MAG: phosphoribosylglycinamide formyltransferase [Ruminococcus sp.]|jgi:phosphoribosylglycinamide formyltransferase-1|nr:phosphoribosylglycinamide formyltransferase [Ruminococcus sp.]